MFLQNQKVLANHSTFRHGELIMSCVNSYFGHTRLIFKEYGTLALTL